MAIHISKDDVIFSVKSFIAAMLALYLALRLGLPRPFWCVITVYVVSQPFAGATKSKAIYRVIGTVTGALIAASVVPRFVSNPILLLMMMSVWIGVCLYFSMMDRTPRSYAILLAGYSVTIISLPSMVDMDAFTATTIFDAALARSEEIILGVTCATVIHSTIRPRGVDMLVMDRIEQSVGTLFKNLSVVLRVGQENTEHIRVIGQLSQMVNEIRTLATHLPFDTSHLKLVTWLVSEYQNRLAALLPIVSSIAKRLKTLREAGLSHQKWHELLERIAVWLEHSDDYDIGYTIRLRQQIDRLAQDHSAMQNAHDVVFMNMAMELHLMINEAERCLTILNHLKAYRQGKTLPAPENIRQTPGIALYVDKRVAIVSALAATIAQGVSCFLWIMSGWPLGGTAPVMAGIYCMFFATMDNPIPALKMQFYWIALSTFTGGVYLLWLLPSIHSFEMMLLVFAPFLILVNALMAVPSTVGRATPFLLLSMCTLTMFDIGASDMTTFINTEISQTLGVGLSILFTYVFRVINVGKMCIRLTKTIWTQIATICIMQRVPSVISVSATMSDGISLLLPRLDTLQNQAGYTQLPEDASVRILSDMCIGLNVARLKRLERRLNAYDIDVQPVLVHFSEYYANKNQLNTQTNTYAVQLIDKLILRVSEIPLLHIRLRTLGALTGIRCELSQ